MTVQKYNKLYTRTKKYVAKYDTYVSLQQIVHILQHFYHSGAASTLRWADVRNTPYSI